MELELYSVSLFPASALLYLCEWYANKEYKKVTNEGIALRNDRRRKFWTKSGIAVFKDKLCRNSIMCMNDGVVT